MQGVIPSQFPFTSCQFPIDILSFAVQERQKHQNEMVDQIESVSDPTPFLSSRIGVTVSGSCIGHFSSLKGQEDISKEPLSGL